MAPKSDRVDAVDHLGVVPAPGCEVILYGPDLATAVGGRIGLAALERVDRARRLGPRLGDNEADAALQGELARVALLAGGRRWSCLLVGWVVIGHGRAQARRA